MKIALIFSGNVSNQTGKFNHVFRRLEAMKRIQGIEIDAFFVQKTYSKMFLFLKRAKVVPGTYTEKNGIKIRNLWIHQTLWEYLLTYRFKSRNFIGEKQILKYTDLFTDYDIVSSNDIESSGLAYELKRKYGIPFVITWHGSDINVFPYHDLGKFRLVRELLITADYNLFVSKQLQTFSDKIVSKGKKAHYYIGPSDIFLKKTETERKEYKEHYGINQETVIGFVGNMVDIKNVMCLPDIFKRLQQRLSSVCFIIVGTGDLLEPLRQKMLKHQVQNVRYLGSLPPEEIPDVMNLLDLLILPSKNEGLPLVCMEAIQCGAHVVGSRVGGISEIIGEKNSIKLDEHFVDNIVNRIIEIINAGMQVEPLRKEFDLNSAIKKELSIYNEIINTRNII